MCTVSWLRHTDGFELFCNRDESRTRAAAKAPAIRELNGVRYAAPTDGEHGGSWVGANEFGLALCLLNRYEDGAGDDARDYTSRGWLLASMLDCSAPEQLGERLARAALSRFRPFTLLVLAPERTASLFHWTGDRLFAEADCEAAMPLTSSSYSTSSVVAVRKRLFRRLASKGLTSDALETFHRSHEPFAGPYSVCMHRPEASTVSLTRVRVGAERVEFRYQPGPPCVGEPSSSLALPRSEKSYQVVRAHERLGRRFG